MEISRIHLHFETSVGGGGVGVLAVHRLRSGREFLKQYLADKQNDYIQSGRLWEVLAYE